ncbi:unnamed protein product [Chironomus riparius]|uniref:rRNA methyltransferase 2, mitochondrial n=1 Tax=Chironomus riparius TaxID=315576 RepID=A0A9N9WRK8_9DIPT|nr:unnamed protein product [Chironomus riparius]
MNQSLIARFYSKLPLSLKGRKKASQEWLIRQFKDPYVEKAKIENYRCRSSFKLIEMNQKYKLLNPGETVIDIGCAPGSWSQVCVRAINSDGRDKTKVKGFLIGIDKQQIYPLEGVTFLGNTDFTTQAAKEKILKALEGRKVTTIVSDMAPNSSGIKSLDQENIMELVNSVFDFSKNLGANTMLVKVWSNGELGKYVNAVKEYYETCRYVKPDASRSDSAEMFILARGFKSKNSTQK